MKVRTDVANAHISDITHSPGACLNDEIKFAILLNDRFASSLNQSFLFDDREIQSNYAVVMSANLFFLNLDSIRIFVAHFKCDSFVVFVLIETF